MMVNKLPKCIRPEEFPLLLKKTPKRDKQARVAFLLAYGSGMRLSEVLHCRPEHIYKDKINILQSKYDRDRVVPRPKGFKDWMLDILPIKKTGRSLERNFKVAAKKAGLNPQYTFHSLRHGFATRLLESGVPINQVQLLLGHSNVSTTSIYVKANPTDALRSYENLF